MSKKKFQACPFENMLLKYKISKNSSSEILLEHNLNVKMVF